MMVWDAATVFAVGAATGAAVTIVIIIMIGALLFADDDPITRWWDET